MPENMPQEARSSDLYEIGEYKLPKDVDPILHLRGLGKEIWQDEEPDDYVRRLRESWVPDQFLQMPT